MGNHRQKVSDKEIINILRNHDDPVLSTGEITEELPIGQRATYNRLQSLSDAGQVVKKKIGARGVIWWPSDLEYTYQSTGQQTVTEENRELLAHLDERDENYYRKRTAVLVAFDYLSRNQEVSRSEFYKKIFSQYNAGYSNKRAWWEKLVRPSLSNSPYVENASRGGTWRYINKN